MGIPAYIRSAALASAIDVLERLGDHAVRDAVEILRQLQAGEAPDARRIRAVGAALLVRNMSPKIRDEEMDVVDRKSFFEAATSMFRVSAPLPSRQHIARVYRDFEAAFSRRPSQAGSKPPIAEET